MRQSLISDEQKNALMKVSFLVGSAEKLIEGIAAPAKQPFSDDILEFLNIVSKNIREDKESRQYPDVVTFGFFIRQASMTALRDRFIGVEGDNTTLQIGRGVAFHIAPSNVAVNYGYSLVAGLVTGNVNIVRIPSKDFPQVNIINKAFKKALEERPDFQPYTHLVKYERSRQINDIFSSVADVRIVWGGDSTIEELRKSPLPPRSGEITFADRYSLAIIDSDRFLSLDNKDRFIEGFYNDTFLTDQNACTSPRIVVWTGDAGNREKAKEYFWTGLHNLAKAKYTYQSIMGVNKLTSAYILASAGSKYNPRIIKSEDNLIVRIVVDNPDDSLMDFKDNSGFFFEYDCDYCMDIRALVDNTHCQTIGYLGDEEAIRPLLLSGIKGVDRVVSIGKTMDFDLIWDGYNLFERLTRTISINL